MFSPQNNRLKLIHKPYPVPRSPHSANSSPRASKSTDFTVKPPKTTQKTSETSTCTDLIKALNDLSNSLEVPSRSLKTSDKDLKVAIDLCKKHLNLANSKIIDLKSFEDLQISDSKTSTEYSSSFIKQGNEEYCAFLEYALSYEQKKNEILIEKSKFPKVRLKEVEKVLNDEFGFKCPGISLCVKSNESGYLDKCKKEVRDMFQKILKKSKESAQIPQETVQMFEDDEGFNFEFRGTGCNELLGIGIQGKNLISSSEKLKNELRVCKYDLQKLSGKYMYLINKFNKQDITLKRQSKILDGISKSTISLKKLFIEFFNEIKGYNSTLVETLSQKSLSRLSGAEFFESEKAIWRCEKEKICKENEDFKLKIATLERRLKRSVEDGLKLRKELEKSENSLELNSNINDIIEIQKLKDQLRLLTFKSNDTISQYQKEQDYYLTQISKLKSENFHFENQLSALKSQFSDLLSQKNQLDKVLNSEPLYLKPGVSDLPRPFQQSSMETLSVGEISSEKSVKVSDIYDLLKEEIDDLVQSLKSHHVFNDFYGNNFELLKKVCEFVISIKENLCEESQFFEETVNSLIREHRVRVFSKHKQAENESFSKDQQKEVYKTKLKVKKTQIELLKQQNIYLKKTVDELREEAQRTSLIELDCIKGMIGNILKDIPKLSNSTEQLISALMNTIGFSSIELNEIKNDRKERKGSGFFTNIIN